MGPGLAEGLPTVSVVIPTYNAPALLLETLETVFAQTYSDFEVVVVNDGSTDDTADRLSAYAAEHADRIARRMRVVHQENQGIGAARNRGIAEARGKYVALLDHDDLWRPEKLAVQVAFMESHPQCIGCSVPWSVSTNPQRSVFALSICDEQGIVRHPLDKLGHGVLFLISSSILFDRERANGLWYETQRQCIEDVAFQIGLLGRGAFGIAGREIQMVYRVHDGSYSTQASFFYNGIRWLRQLDRQGRFAEFSGDERKELGRYLAHIGRTAATRQLLGGKRFRAMRLFLEEFSYQARLGRFKFLVFFPLMVFSPAGILRRRWKGTVR